MKDDVEVYEVDEVEVEEVSSSGVSSTLDYFLSAEPEAKVTKDVEVKRLGLVFTLSAIEDDALKTCMKRSEKRQTKMEKQRGLTPERDAALMEALVIVESCIEIKKRLISHEQALETGEVEFASPVKLTDPQLIERWGPRPHDVITKWLLPGERSQMADTVTDLAGYETNSVVEAGN